MKRYRVLKDAERDLDAIFLYWAERASLQAADRLVDAIAERFWLLGEHPEAGRSCPDISRGVRCFPAGRSFTARGTAKQRGKTSSRHPDKVVAWPCTLLPRQCGQRSVGGRRTRGNANPQRADLKSDGRGGRKELDRAAYVGGLRIFF